ncbi:hypothetical protein [Novosphingobium sp. 9U]|uniref:hypothetical protein n=1 Tax=Novosphingobium sp. 9U TaxID=2653158 RepID=UPI001F25EF39|nr:hypothetical protein [Novosphingobium sp. 9U]
MRSRTQHDYVRQVRAFAASLRRSPDEATAEDVAASRFTSASTVWRVHHQRLCIGVAVRSSM